MAKVSIIIEDTDDNNVVISLEGDTGNSLDKDSPPPTNAQQMAWQVMFFLESSGVGGTVEKVEIEEQAPKG